MHFNDMEEQEAKFPAREEEREAPGKKKVLCEVTERGKIDSNGQIVYYLGGSPPRCTYTDLTCNRIPKVWRTELQGRPSLIPGLASGWHRCEIDPNNTANALKTELRLDQDNTESRFELVAWT